MSGLGPACPNSASSSRTPTASAPKPKTSKARPPRATKGPKQAQATIRSSEGDREAVDMDITTPSCPSRRPDVTRPGATTRCHNRTPDPRVSTPAVNRRCAAVTGAVSVGAPKTHRLQSPEESPTRSVARVRATARAPRGRRDTNECSLGKTVPPQDRPLRRRRRRQPPLRVRACHVKPVGRRHGAAVHGLM